MLPRQRQSRKAGARGAGRAARRLLL